MKRYWLYLGTALLWGASCVLAVGKQRLLLASLLGVTALLNLAIFWVKHKRY